MRFVCSLCVYSDFSESGLKVDGRLRPCLECRQDTGDDKPTKWIGKPIPAYRCENCRYLSNPMWKKSCKNCKSIGKTVPTGWKEIKS